MFQTTNQCKMEMSKHMATGYYLLPQTIELSYTWMITWGPQVDTLETTLDDLPYTCCGHVGRRDGLEEM